jgi:ATP-binding cassette subfamily B protein
VVVASLELAFAAWILGSGAAGALHLGLLAAWVVLTAVLAWRYTGVLGCWTQQRLDMTNDLVERMVGHRTGLVQEQAVRRDAADDRGIQGYLQTSREMDRAITPIVAAAPGGWILLALLGLGPAFVGGTATPAGLAISLGGILFAHRALGGISGGLSSLARAGLAWRRVGPIFDAGLQVADRAPYIGYEQLQGPLRGSSKPLVDASHLVFGYPTGQPVLRGAELRIHAGERVLLQGASGGGKSTLAALLVGLRQPASGLLLLNGLDRPTLGESWHALATEAPQFHENHVLTGTLAFNLLMGRGWPASPALLQEARAVCDELGLGPLIERMPAGLQQRVGETGWQLSHGEKSRLFLARALLQRSALTVLDESFAALDPQTLQRSLACALQRTKALLVIAHP